MDTIFIEKFQRGIIPLKMKVELRFLFSAHRLMVVYIWTKFHEIIFQGIKVINGHDFHGKNFKGA